MPDTLRFITCGSVEDGKSALIGRLLLESKQVFENQLAALAKDSTRYRTPLIGRAKPSFHRLTLCFSFAQPARKGEAMPELHVYFNAYKSIVIFMYAGFIATFQS